jgi:DNA-binding transcriptional ArsR family regulator
MTAERGDRDTDGNGRRRAELISALNHPSRRQVLRLFLDRGQRLSPVEIAKELAFPLGTTSYHVKLLADLHALRPAGTQQARGAQQRFYEVTIEDDPPIETLLEETRETDEACAEERRKKLGGGGKRGKRK